MLAFLILIVFISGCPDFNGGDEVKPELNDNALKMDVKIREKEEDRRILPDQTIRMTVTLTNQVENATKNVYLNITNPYGIHISKVDCGDDCICEWEEGGSRRIDTKGGCNGDVQCDYNRCYFRSIQSQDEIDITYGLKIPDEEEISEMGRDLKPKIELEYEYEGTSALYLPIYKYGEKPVDPKKESTQTTGPIHVDIDSDDWVRAGDLFPIYIDVKDVVRSSEKIVIDNAAFTMTVDHADINDPEIGRCDFNLSGSVYNPEEDLELPLINPLVCTLKARDEETAPPMVRAPIIIGYSYKYKIGKTETIRVEKAFLGIF